MINTDRTFCVRGCHNMKCNRNILHLQGQEVQWLSVAKFEDCEHFVEGDDKNVHKRIKKNIKRHS